MSIHTGLSLFLDPHLEQRIAEDGDVGFGRRSSLAYYRWCLSGSPQMQGTHVEPGISQFRRLWATSIATIISTTMRNHQEFDVEMLYAAAEAHPDWEILSDRTGLRHEGSEPPRTPSELLVWFLKKGRH